MPPLVAAVAMVGALGMAASFAAAGDEAVPAGVIAYSDSRICRVNADGTALRCLTRGEDYGPVSWSANGNRLAFERSYDITPGERSEVWTVGANGGNQIRVTPPGREDGAPAFSPVAPQLTFVRYDRRRNGEQDGIMISREDGTRPRLLVDDGSFPNWAPDGRKIAFLNDAGGISVINTDGTQRRLVVRGVRANTLEWSPDGRMLAFDNDAKGHVFIVNADGTGLHRLTRAFKEDYQPAWSPDGSTIALTCFRTNEDICTVNVDGSQPMRLTTNRRADFRPAWSPDSQWLAYVGYGGQIVSGVFVVRPDGTARRRVTRSSHDLPPTWKP